jgi:hypothetical protein
VCLLRYFPLYHILGGSDAGLGNATPDQEKGGRETLAYVSDGPPGRSQKLFFAWLVWTLV